MTILTTKRVRELYGMAVHWDSAEKTAPIRESNLAEFDAWIEQHDREVQAAALTDAAAKIESKRTLLGIASRALDIGQAWSAALLRDDAKRLRDGGAA